MMKTLQKHYRILRNSLKKELKRCKSFNISKHNSKPSETSTKMFQKEFLTCISLLSSQPTLSLLTNGLFNSTSTSIKDQLRNLYPESKIDAKTSQKNSKSTSMNHFVEVYSKKINSSFLSLYVPKFQLLRKRLKIMRLDS